MRSARIVSVLLLLLSVRPAFAQFHALTKNPLGQNAMGYGVAWCDFDGDGDQDLYVSNDGPNVLIRNDGNDQFTDVSGPPLDNPDNGGAAVWGDVDNDGDLDLYLTNYMTSNKFFRNDGGAGFHDATAGPLADVGPSQGAAWADYDRDGDLDLYLVHYGTPRGGITTTMETPISTSPTTVPIDCCATTATERLRGSWALP
jgi:VCBS repeat protein